MNRLALTLVGFCLIASCASGDADEASVVTRRSALQAPSLVPMPCDSNGDFVWEGTTTDLLFADALAECSSADKITGLLSEGSGDDPFVRLYGGTDRHLERISALMNMAVSAANSPTADGSAPSSPDERDTLQRWADLRRNENFNCDPTTGETTSASLREDTGIWEYLKGPNGENPDINTVLRAQAAQTDLRYAPLNLCVAQRLRSYAPGASAGPLLLEPEYQQRELLEVIRERSQLATVQYALLGTVFAQNTTAPPADSNRGASVWDLNKWSVDVARGNGPSRMAPMGDDFASAVQLTVVVAEELQELIGRSRSQRSATQVHPEGNRFDSEWGRTSWHQRQLIASFGGDPLAVENDGPWKHALSLEYPAKGGASFNALPHDWPSDELAPYVSVDMTDPRVSEALNIARSLDLVQLGNSAGCEWQETAQEFGSELYGALEFHYRLAHCYWEPTNPNNPGDGESCPTTLADVQPPPNDTDLANALLWQRFRLTPDHTARMVAYLRSAVDPHRIWCQDQQQFSYFRNNRIGFHRLVGDISGDSPVQLSADFQLVERGLVDWAPTYSKFSARRFPDPNEIRLDLHHKGMGFHADPDGTKVIASNTALGIPVGVPEAEAKRTLGTMVALASTRRMLSETVAYLQSGNGNVSRMNDYFARHDDIARVIDSAIGVETVNFRPVLSANETSKEYEVASPGPSESTWKVDIVVEDDDVLLDTEVGEEWRLFASGHPLATDAVQSPSSTYVMPDGSTVVSAHLLEAAAYAGTALVEASPGRVSAEVDLPGGPLITHVLTLFAHKYAGGVPTQNYRLITGPTRIQADEVRAGYSLAFGGKLGTVTEQQVQALEWNAARHRYDGFGYRTDWVPPLSAELVGGPAGGDSYQHYLQLARTSSNEATGAVEKALDGLLAEQSDEVALEVATARAKQGIKEAREQLCGSESGSCNIEFEKTNPELSWWGVNPTPGENPLNPEVEERLNKILRALEHRLTNLDITVAKPVLNRVYEPSVPQFDEYSGGALQSALIEQWRALIAPREMMKSLRSEKTIALSQLQMADNALLPLRKEMREACGSEGEMNALASGLSVTYGPPSFSFGPWVANSERCEELTRTVQLTIKNILEQKKQAVAAFAASIQGIIDAEAAIQQSSATIARLINDTKLAVAREELEVELTKQSLKTSFGLYRRYRAYDAWRAKALLENSRRHALAARRAVEARFVVDLTDQTQPEAFVHSPASWADEVYSYDLSLPNAVGVSASGGQEAGGIYTNKVSDYVTNLEGFIAGYAVSRPAAVAQGELDVVTLYGLSGGEPIDVTVGSGASATILADRGKWQVQCGDEEQWVSVPPGVAASEACSCHLGGCVDADGVCDEACASQYSCVQCACTDMADVCDTSCFSACRLESQVTRARIGFTLDPWGRINDGIGTSPYEARYNARWTRLAVNLVGTGLKDCLASDDPLSCYNEAYAQYSLRHVGPAWVTNFEGAWTLLPVPTGRIEGGKALAAELWFDPLKDGWATSYVGAVSRSEFDKRPMGGAYELTIEAGAELNLDRLERVQILVGSEYWVVQE